MERSAWLHLLLTVYLWLISWIPLGNWNRQREGTLLQVLLGGRGIDVEDLGMLVFVTLPGVLFWLAYKRRSFWFALPALSLDVVWLIMQIESWWLPYILGTDKRWQLAYAKGPTTKLLPSFGNHVAPDGTHLVIHVLLIAALFTGVAGLRQVAKPTLTRTSAGGV
ncbi:MAG: hypothetical protein U0Q18_16065 [Bryobacteraceae bacterium]